MTDSSLKAHLTVYLKGENDPLKYYNIGVASENAYRIRKASEENSRWVTLENDHHQEVICSYKAISLKDIRSFEVWIA